MPWTITRLCTDCVDTGCVSVCPVDCIYEYVGEDKEHFPDMLYIQSEGCIDCGACEPECPWQAIFEEPAVPDVFKDDIAPTSSRPGPNPTGSGARWRNAKAKVLMRRVDTAPPKAAAKSNQSIK